MAVLRWYASAVCVMHPCLRGLCVQASIPSGLTAGRRLVPDTVLRPLSRHLYPITRAHSPCMAGKRAGVKKTGTGATGIGCSASGSSCPTVPMLRAPVPCSILALCHRVVDLLWGKGPGMRSECFSCRLLRWSGLRRTLTFFEVREAMGSTRTPRVGDADLDRVRVGRRGSNFA